MSLSGASSTCLTVRRAPAPVSPSINGGCLLLLSIVRGRSAGARGASRHTLTPEGARSERGGGQLQQVLGGLPCHRGRRWDAIRLRRWLRVRPPPLPPLPRVQLPHLRCLCRPPTRPSWAKSTAKQPNCRPRGSLLSAADMHETHRPCERCPAASNAASSTAPAAKTRAQRGS